MVQPALPAEAGQVEPEGRLRLQLQLALGEGQLDPADPLLLEPEPAEEAAERLQFQLQLVVSRSSVLGYYTTTTRLLRLDY